MKQFSQRQLQFAENIKRILSELFLKEDVFLVNERKTVNITITEVQVTPDLKEATVFFYTLNAPANNQNYIKSVITAIEGIKLDLRKKLGNKLSSKFLPHIKFVWDDALEKAIKINEAIKKG
jgi:ribosome-binding factor A